MIQREDFPYLQSLVINDAYAVKNLTVPEWVAGAVTGLPERSPAIDAPATIRTRERIARRASRLTVAYRQEVPGA